MTLKDIEEIFRQAESLGSISSIYFEGGEPFLYYPIMLRAIRMAAEKGFSSGVVTNGYWATGAEDAAEWLRPLSGLISDLSVSSDLYHESEPAGLKAKFAAEAAGKLGIPNGIIGIAQPEEADGSSPSGQIPKGKSSVMYKGRAAVKLTERAVQRPWREFTECPFEDLEEPGRVHVDPFGNLHICQGIVVGNLFTTPLTAICERYDIATHPITGPLHRGGPVELFDHYNLPKREKYADACHMCYEARRNLRPRFVDILTPDQMYGSPCE
jgi:MoaA/NifB/PqqE/SkfB family radical SAM enzyme